MIYIPKKFVATCLLNFLVAALLGLLLRYAMVGEIGINYRFLTHAHSHVAMLGWVYLMLFTFFLYYFVPYKGRVYNRLFWLTQLSVLGMMFSFPFQGYAAVSISFSTLHILCSYAFAYRIWKDLKINNPLVESFVRWALVFMVLSTVGVWCLGPAVGLMGKTSAFYQIAIQCFLHFQFNGWFLFAVIAVLFHQLNIKKTKTSKVFLYVLIAATICTLALPVQWFAPHGTLPYINAIGVVLQLIALYYFLKLIKIPYRTIIVKHQKILRVLYAFSLGCFILKMVLQTTAVIPNFSITLINHKNFIIGFIHLMMLGVISGFLFAFLIFSKTIKPSRIFKLGIYSFLIGFSLTELLLAYQGGLLYFGMGQLQQYHQLLFWSSMFLPLGIAIISTSYLKQKHYVQQTS